MKKYGIVSHTKDFPSFLNDLQNFGLVDITQTTRNFEGKEKKILNWLMACNKAIQHLEFYRTDPDNETPTFFNSHLKATYILKYHQKKVAEFEQIDAEIKQRHKLYDEQHPWGNYKPEIIEKLYKNGLKILFFTCDKRIFDLKWAENHDLEVINELHEQVYFVVMTPIDEKIQIAANEVKLPDISLTKQQEELDALQFRKDTLIEAFKRMASHLPALHEEHARLQNALSFDRVITHAAVLAEGSARVIEGFIPEEKEAELVAFLDKQPIYYTSMNVDSHENVPVLLKNNRFAKLFEPITKIFSLPLHNELDLTPFFAPFFMMFVGFCTGDSGYGLLIVLAGFFLKRKLKNEFRPLVSLAQWFGFAAIIFGLLSGTFFGIGLMDVPLFSRFKHLFFDQDKMMFSALALGAVQIIFGMILNIANIVRKQGIKYAIGKIGWLTLLLSLAAAYGLPAFGVVISNTMMTFFYTLFAISGIAIFFFNSPGTNPMMQVGIGVWDAYNMATGLLGDLLSYMRLFALGLTGGILGMVFNSLALDLSPDIPVVGTLITLFILLFGHTLNFALTMLGAIVHPLRLTFVEFYKNSGFTGGGREYTPFERKIKQS